MLGEHFTSAKAFSHFSAEPPQQSFQERWCYYPLLVKEKEIKTQAICSGAKWRPPVTVISLVESKFQALPTCHTINHTQLYGDTQNVLSLLLKKLWSQRPIGFLETQLMNMLAQEPGRFHAKCLWIFTEMPARP